MMKRTKGRIEPAFALNTIVSGETNMSDNIITKQCSKCKQIKKLTEFSKKKSTGDGFQCWCKACVADAHHDYRATDAGKKVQRRANSKYYASDAGKKASRRNGVKYRTTDKGKKTQLRGAAKYRRLHPERIKARNAVTYAIQTGKLPKVSTLVCPCKKPADQYHHHRGYAKKHQLDVVPRCTRCHNKLLNITI